MGGILMEFKEKNTVSNELDKKKPKPPTGDLDDFIFKDEEIKYQSER